MWDDPYAIEKAYPYAIEKAYPHGLYQVFYFIWMILDYVICGIANLT